MAGTRSSARLNSSPQSANSASGTKRKADDTTPTSKAKRGRPSKEQKTLEETLAGAEDDTETKDVEIEDADADADAEATDNGESLRRALHSRLLIRLRSEWQA